MSPDTIAAIATPLGQAGISVIRLSGGQSLEVAGRCFRRPGSKPIDLRSLPSHTVHYGFIEREGIRLDEVLLTILRAPRTFTREDVVEISCHGGLLPTRLVLEAILACGARLAAPGEFTRRAFLNGRIDLTQAEAVADIIHARTDLALQAAQEQLSGHLARRIHTLRDNLIRVQAHVEAHIDFPDEDIAPDTRETLIRRLREAADFMRDLLRTAREGQLLREGVRAVIVGRPNAGKSSLLNQLLGRDRAIVSPIPGTTRDTIEASASIRGIPILFIDTAGLRDAGDAIEEEGIRRTLQTLSEAEIIIHLIDGSQPLESSDQKHLQTLPREKTLVVCNKSDLPRKLELPPGSPSVIEISCTTSEGLESLKDALKERLWSGAIAGEMLQVMINARHQEALNRALFSTETATKALEQNLTLELAAMDLRIATQAVGEIVGKTTTEDLLDSIFSQFCLGK